MGRSESPPFPRGQTAFSGNTPNANDFSQWLGKTWVFEDLDYNASMTVSGSAKPARSGRFVKCMAVRNVSGGALLPKMLAHMNVSGSGVNFLQEVDGYPSAVGQLCYPVDEFLPAAGVANNDVFWVVVKGPAMCITDSAGDTNISIGSMVVPGVGTAGRVVDQDTTVVTGPGLYNQIQGAIGRAIKAVNAVSTDILIDVQGPGAQVE